MVMYFDRIIDKYLIEWKNSPIHKPLLLRGARQVGKSSAIRHLGMTFEYYIEVNFERQSDVRTLFQEVDDVHELANRLGLLYNVPVVAGRTLLFLDEIQASEAAIKSLWFFKEDFPELHVAAAGSLLEFVLKDLSSFGVGRIRSLFMYPFSFDEFLSANGKASWIQAKQAANGEHPLDIAMHHGLIQQYRIFLMVGGMPASVAAWVSSHDYNLCREEQDDVLITYYDDFSKYAGKVDPALLRKTLQSVVMQRGRKFIFSKVEGHYRLDDVKKALSMLCDAGLIKRVSHTAANGLPLGAEVNLKFRKYIFADSGLLLRTLDMDLGGSRDLTQLILAGAAESLVNKGDLAELVLGWEMVKYGSPKSQHELYYWENTAAGTTSEVDYLMAKEMKVLPVECKSGISGKMKSLHYFMRNRHLDYAVRCSLENFGTLSISESDGNDRRIEIIPLYAVSNLLM
ncbi:MAG: ATP-binding protein [Bacteroidales bacterium]|nr:ATP-binding protein [Bacteroidales bacterium]